MRKMERIIIYAMAVFAILYGFVIHNQLQDERSVNRLRLAYYYPRIEPDDYDELYISLDDYDKIVIELSTGSLSEKTRMRLGKFLYFWAEYQDRWRHWKNAMIAQTKLEKIKAELEETQAILKWCESEKK